MEKLCKTDPEFMERSKYFAFDEVPGAGGAVKKRVQIIRIDR